LEPGNRRAVPDDPKAQAATASQPRLNRKTDARRRRGRDCPGGLPLARQHPAPDALSLAGGYRHDHYGSQILAAAVRRAGLPEGTTSHGLRHHYASVLLAAGESVVAVAERLGHENATLVLKTYGHLMPDSEDRTRRAIDEAWCATTVPSDQAKTR
jgi:integrase